MKSKRIRILRVVWVIKPLLEASQAHTVSVAELFNEVFHDKFAKFVLDLFFALLWTFFVFLLLQLKLFVSQIDNRECFNQQIIVDPLTFNSAFL